MSNPFLKLRKRLKITQRALSVRLNRTITTIANWENGNNVPSLTEADQLAIGYGTTRDEIERAIVVASRELKRGAAA